MNHCFYTGFLTHKRFIPIQHKFCYQVLYYFLDLDELPNYLTDHNKLFCNKLFWPSFQQENYLKGISQDDSVKKRLIKACKPLGVVIDKQKVFMLTQLTIGRCCFNPLTLYYIYEHDETLQAILAEVTNTPWKKRHLYLLNPHDKKSLTHKKRFHVSPLLPMELNYQWQINQPREKLLVKIEASSQQQPWFRANLTLQRQPFSQENLKRLLRRYPLMTYKIIIAIYWQALRLKLSGAKYYPYQR